MDNHQQDTFRVNLNINTFDNNDNNDNNNNNDNNTTTNFTETTNFIDNLYKSINSNTTTQILALTTVSHLLIQTIRK